MEHAHDRTIGRKTGAETMEKGTRVVPVEGSVVNMHPELTAYRHE